MRITFKYCGSCNPEIDLAQTGRLLAGEIEQQGWQPVTPEAGEKTDVLVLLCGCPRTCIDKDDLSAQAKQLVLVAGQRLNWQPVAEAALPRAVIEAIQNYNKTGMQ